MNSAVDEERRGVGEVALLALVDRVLRAARSRWSRNDSDMVPAKSSIGQISSKISSRPDCLGDVGAAAASWPPRRAPSRSSLPSSQSKLSVCRARRFGTSSGSRILANETRGGAAGRVALSLAREVREAAKRGPSDATLSWTLARARRTTLANPALRRARGTRAARDVGGQRKEAAYRLRSRRCRAGSTHPLDRSGTSGREAQRRSG